ncbi:MAG: MmcQ/YjbR family DNA-binding protein [Defluviitaleaceae bacterium]|nr:MmcQ/YjbR family DNA-binding protein [Defluviitaleaceae bacterium]
MTRKTLIEYCLTFPNVYEDYPFNDGDNKNEGVRTTVIRHRVNKKMFALINERNGKLGINLKCDPFEADVLRQMYGDVTPGWHMNKKHWNTVTFGGDVPEEELKRMIGNSYDLIKPKVRVQKQYK